MKALMTIESPLLVQVTRTPNVESEHLVDVVVADRSGLVSAWGDPARRVMARSAIKPIQTLPLLRSGAAEAFALTDEQIALASASHSGEAQHIQAVEKWLAAIGGTQEWLECGAAEPIGTEAAYEVGPDFAAIHNCCSGKHTGFLTLAAHLGIDHRHYIAADHEIQRLITDAVGVLTGFAMESVEPGVDGCGIPTHPIPLVNLAHGMARLVDPTELDDSWHAPCRRVVQALDAHPWWLSGTGRHETLLHKDKLEPLACKTGADGVFTAALPNRGLGIACKARDGSKRASDAAITWVLSTLGVIEPNASTQNVTNAAGTVVGEITVHGRSFVD